MSISNSRLNTTFIFIEAQRTKVAMQARHNISFSHALFSGLILELVCVVQLFTGDSGYVFNVSIYWYQ